MAQLSDVIAYILKYYPVKDHCSNARVTKMIYLSDWRHVLTTGYQITDIVWYFDNYGPFVHDIQNTVDENTALFGSQYVLNPFGEKKLLLYLKNAEYEPNISHEEKLSINHIISVTKDRNWGQFIRLVYSTHPILSSDKYSKLNLLNKADEYKKLGMFTSAAS